MPAQESTVIRNVGMGFHTEDTHIPKVEDVIDNAFNSNTHHLHNLESPHEINHYHLSYYFEIAVECINSIAGLIILFAVFLAIVNLFIVAINASTGRNVYTW